MDGCARRGRGLRGPMIRLGRIQQNVPAFQGRPERSMKVKMAPGDSQCQLSQQVIWDMFSNTEAQTPQMY